MPSVSNLSVQAAHVEQLVADSLNTTENVDKGNKELKKALDISHFDINAILRGAQLTLVGGGFIALQGGFNFGVSGS